MTSPVSKLPEVLGSAYAEITAFAGKQGYKLEGTPFVMYYNMDMNNLDIEAGFPVSGSIEADGRIKPSVIPGGEKAVAIHKGPYNTLEKTYTALSNWLQQQGRIPEEFMYEEYLNSPDEVKPEELLTKIYFYLK